MSIIELYFLILAVSAQIFNPIADLVIPIGMLIKEEKPEMGKNGKLEMGNGKNCNPVI